MDTVLGTGLAFVAVGVLAGLCATIAGLASLVSYPALLAFGLSPVAANVTNTVALVATGLGAATGSRPELAGQRRRLMRFGIVSAVGGSLGALVLLVTPPTSFEVVVPYLVAGACLVVLVQPWLTRWLRGRRAGRAAGWPVSDKAVDTDAADSAPDSAADSAPDNAAENVADNVADTGRRPPEGRIGALVAVGTVAFYGGYFGAASGVLMLAVLTAVLAEGLPRVNALKNTLSIAANGMAALGFAIFGPVDWPVALPLAVGFFIGGRLGPIVVRRVPAAAIRVVIAVAGLGLAARLAWTAHG